MYTYRSLRIPWTDKVTNAEVNKQKELLTTLKMRITEYFGYIMRGEKYEILRLLIE